MLSILQIPFHINVLTINTLQLYFWYTKLVYLKSVKLEQLILYLTRNSAEVQLKIAIFDGTKMELMQTTQI